MISNWDQTLLTPDFNLDSIVLTWGSGLGLTLTKDQIVLTWTDMVLLGTGLSYAGP